MKDALRISRREMLERSVGLGVFGLLPAKMLWGDDGIEVDGVRLPEWAVDEIRDGVVRYRAWKGADTYYGELNHYGMYWLKWADVRRRRN